MEESRNEKSQECRRALLRQARWFKFGISSACYLAVRAWPVVSSRLCLSQDDGKPMDGGRKRFRGMWGRRRARHSQQRVSLFGGLEEYVCDSESGEPDRVWVLRWQKGWTRASEFANGEQTNKRSTRRSDGPLTEGPVRFSSQLLLA